MGLCHQRGNIRVRKSRWEPCVPREAGVLQAGGTRQCKGPGGRRPGTSGQQGRGQNQASVQWDEGYVIFKSVAQFPSCWALVGTPLAAHTGWTREQGQKQGGWGQNWV